MLSYVYKSHRRADTYVYLVRRDDFDALPTALREQLGELSFVLEVLLSAERKLARAEATAVIAQLAEQGYYLQLPPSPETLSPGG